jgi:hypothetical protein
MGESDETDDFTQLDDVAFIAERRRVRELLEQTPARALSLTDRYRALNDEFIRRARIAWRQAS